MNNEHSTVKAGDKVRVGKNKTVWTVTRVTAPGEGTMIQPAGIYIARPSGQHRGFSWEWLADHPLTVVNP